MRRFVTLFFVLVLLASGAALGDEAVVLANAEADDGRAQIEVRQHSDSAIVLEYVAGAVRASAVETAGGPFTRLSLTGAGRTGEIGQAALPAMRRTIEVPPGCSVVIESESVRTERVTLADLDLPARLFPVQEPVPKTDGADARPFRIDAGYYQRNDRTPAPWAVVERTAVLRGRGLATVAIHPVRYLPASGEVEVLTHGVFRLRIEGDPRPIDPRLRAAPADRLIARLTGQPERGLDLPDGPAGYLIVAAAHLADSADLAEFAAWKAQTGYEVTVLSTADVGSTASEIREVVRQAYQTWEIPPLYLLLAGDTTDIGFFYGEADDTPSTDLYFTTVDGDDTVPDLWVGRLPVSFADELTAAIGKILSFEEALWETADPWETRAVFIASTDHYYQTEVTHNDVIEDYLDPAGYDSQRLYAQTTGADTGDVFDALNDGASLAVYSGHGDVTFWVDPFFDEGDVEALAPAVYPVVHSYACLTGRYEYAEAFCDTWLRHGAGAVAFWGASAWSYWDEDDLLEHALFEGFFGADDPADNLTWLAGMNDYALASVEEFYGETDTTLLYREMYNLFGDPSLDVWTAEPEEIAASHDAVIDADAGTFAVEVPGVAGARAALSADGVCYGAAYTDEDGTAHVTLVRAPGETSALTLAVTGHDLLPYLAEIPVGIGDFVLDELTATGGAGRIEIAWAVHGEDEIEGYVLHRAAEENGTYERITDEPVASGAGSYEYADEGLPAAATFWYRLEVVALDGRSVTYGPVSATTDADDADEDGDDDDGCGC